MFENFQLAAIVGQGAQTSLNRVPLHQDVQMDLAGSWGYYYRKFVESAREIDFIPGYKPENDERFCLTIHTPPDWLRDERSDSIRDCEPIGKSESDLDGVKGLAAFVRNSGGSELVLFQNFNRSRVIRPSYSLLEERGTYVSVRRPGVMLDSKLSAVYQSHDRKLLFSNFYNVNTFLPLSHYYQEASEQDIRTMLDHPLLAPEDVDALAIGANQWFRVRFGMLAQSGILDEYSAEQICAQSDGFPVEIRLRNGQVVFPAEKSQAKRLLQFLNEELFQGAITETLYETNSKRRAR